MENNEEVKRRVHIDGSGNMFGDQSYKDNAIRAAKQLFYGDKVIDLIKEAKTEDEISNIMHDARCGKI